MLSKKASVNNWKATLTNMKVRNMKVDNKNASFDDKKTVAEKYTY